VGPAGPVCRPGPVSAQGGVGFPARADGARGASSVKSSGPERHSPSRFLDVLGAMLDGGCSGSEWESTAISACAAGGSPGGSRARLASQGVGGGEEAGSSPVGEKGEPGRVPVLVLVTSGEAAPAEAVRASSSVTEGGWSELSSSRRVPAGATQAISHPAAASETIRCRLAIFSVSADEGRVEVFELYS
jgi:hypothetical protein